MIQKVQIKRIAVVFVLIAICLSLVSCASAPSVSTETVSQPLETEENYPIPAEREPVPLDGKKLTIGIWCGTHHDFFFATMMLLKEAGIDQIIGPDDLWTGEDGMVEMLDRAEQFGISVIPNLRGWDLNEVPSYADHPALQGFLMWDEPSATDFDWLADAKAKFRSLMPEDKVFYVNLFPQPCSYESLYGENYDRNAVNYETNYVDVFLRKVQPEQLSVDYYPLMEGNLIRPSYYQNLETLAYRAKDNCIPLEVTVQNAGHDTTDGRYVSPSVQQLRWQMAVAMTYGASTLDHYIFTSHEETYAPMVDFNTLKPTELFENAKTVDLELRAWEDIYCSYRWLGSGKVDTAESNMMLLRLTKSLPQDQWGVLSNIESDGDVIFGIFENAYGENAYMITNAGSTTEIPGKDYLANFEINDANVCLQFNVENCHYLKVISGGESEYVKQSADGTFQLTIPAYDGVFVIPLVEN